MKKLTFLLLIATVILLDACKKEELMPGPRNLGHLELGDFIEMIPIDTAKTYKYAVYKNERGDDKRMEIEWFELEREGSYGTSIFSFEQVNIQYYDPEDATYQLSVIAGGGLDAPAQTLFRSLGVRILSSRMVAASINIDDNREDNDSLLQRFRPSLQIRDQVFENIYEGKWPEESMPNTSFQELYYNTRLGIVAFEGWNDTLWVLDRFER